MSRRVVLAVVVCLASFVLVYRQVVTKLVQDWATDDNYSHGFLIAPMAAYFAFERRAQLGAQHSRPSSVGLLVVLASLGVLIAGELGAERFLTRISMVGTIAGSILFVWGTGHLRILTFPVTFLLLMIPLPAMLFNQIALPLQLIASAFGEGVLRLAGVPVLREGNVIHLSNAALEVADACSGIRSLISLLTLGIVLAYFLDRRVWVRTIVAAATVPVAIVANGLRVAGTGIAASRIGADAATGFFHTFSGWVVFLVALSLLWLIQRLVIAIAPSGALSGPRLGATQ